MTRRRPWDDSGLDVLRRIEPTTAGAPEDPRQDFKDKVVSTALERVGHRTDAAYVTHHDALRAVLAAADVAYDIANQTMKPEQPEGEA